MPGTHKSQVRTCEIQALVHPSVSAAQSKFELVKCNQVLHPPVSRAQFQSDVIRMPTTPERAHVVPGAPETHFRGVKHFDLLLPKAAGPQILSHAERHEGDGGAGTISTYVLHPREGGTLTLKTFMDVVDETTHTFVASVQGDPRYTFLKFTVRFLPGPSADTSTVTCFAEYTPVSGDTPPPDNIIDMVPHLLNNFAAHVDAHFADEPKK